VVKEILRWFEVASGLKAHFHKRSIMGVHLTQEFHQLAGSFLHCKKRNILFCYLGLSVGANPRLKSAWQPLIDSLDARLGSWSRLVILGGTIVLLNSVPNSVPILFLSFLKLPVGVWQNIVRL